MTSLDPRAQRCAMKRASMLVSVLCLAGCGASLTPLPPSASPAALFEHGRSLAAEAGAGDSRGVAELRDAALQAFSRACNAGHEDACRQTVRYWVNVVRQDSGQIDREVVDARTGASVPDQVPAELSSRARAELENAWSHLLEASSLRATSAALSIHDLTPLERLRDEFPGSNIEEPGFFALAMAEESVEPSRRYLQGYAANHSEHGVRVRRHLAEAEYRILLDSLGQSPAWEPLRSFALRYPDLHIEEPEAFQRASATHDVSLLSWYEQRNAHAEGISQQHLTAVRERHAALVLAPLLAAPCSVSSIDALASASATFRETAAGIEAAVRALSCTQVPAGANEIELLSHTASGFAGTPAGNAAMEREAVASADFAIRSREPEQMYAYLSGRSGSENQRVLTALAGELRNPRRSLSAEELGLLVSRFPDAPERPAIQALQEAVVRREERAATAEAARQEREERATEEREAREERAEQRAEEARQAREERAERAQQARDERPPRTEHRRSSHSHSSSEDADERNCCRHCRGHWSGEDGCVGGGFMCMLGCSVGTGMSQGLEE